MAFVWDVYNTAIEYVEKRQSRATISDLPYQSGSKYTFNKNNGIYTIGGTITVLIPYSTTKTINAYVVKEKKSDYKLSTNYTKKTGEAMYYAKTGTFSENDDGTYNWYTTLTYEYTSTATTVKSTLNTATASTSSSAYPQDAVSGSYWYTFRGAPSGISYPTNIEAGQAVQITWEAGTNPLYYRVERSTDGGASWQVLSATVTATSFTDTSIAGDTSSPSVMYRVCTLGEMAVSDYSTGSEVNIPRCSVRIKMNGAWVKGKATYRKENGAWVIIPMADEEAIIGADTHRKVILLTS